ncbi:hypothetical protein FRC03_009097 [Tulasnella sp. 419]|nr:hypothetical protein FRC03_009097 [Tulasnella sp. 419]
MHLKAPEVPITARVLPIELYAIIFQHVAKTKDLCSLARCSSTFQLAAEPFIYHSVSSSTMIRFINAAKSIISTPRRHRLVKTLEMVESPYFMPASVFYDSTMPRLVARLLMVTSQLRSLKIDCFLQSRWLLKDRNHPLLVTLSINIPAVRLESQFQVKNQLHNWEYLKRQVNITKLTLEVENGESSAIFWDSRHHLPHLKTLVYIGPSPSGLLKDRHLQEIRFKLKSIHDSELVSCLPNMGSTLQILDLSESWCVGWQWSSMQDLMRSLPSLRCLGLPPDWQDVYNEDDLIHILQSCPPTLEILRLAHRRRFDELKLNLSKLFSARESLKWIIIASSWTLLFGDGVFAMESPDRALSDRSGLIDALWELGVRTDPWKYLPSKLMEIFGEGLISERDPLIENTQQWRLVRGL